MIYQNIEEDKIWPQFKRQSAISVQRAQTVGITQYPDQINKKPNQVENKKLCVMEKSKVHKCILHDIRLL